VRNSLRHIGHRVTEFLRQGATSASLGYGQGVPEQPDGPPRPESADERSTYWESVHDGKDVDAVSWWQSVPGLSLDLVDRAGVGPEAAIIDVGAGWSTLVDHLLALGHRDLTAIDLSTTALATVRERIGPAGADVTLEVADVLDFRPSRRYALWHDRAVYHFLTEPDERADYLDSLHRSLEPGGWVVVATFGPQGPTTCSGLPIVRYSHEELAAQFPGFDVVDTAGEDHATPWGSTQQFTALLLRQLT
jgi:cyclopropane fatty-acyl-phospholipid synthase-like methyltransferase